MEARKIRFVLNNMTGQKSIMSTATTLGELKAEMREAGIDYTDMAFHEGRTRTEMRDDNAILPTNINIPSKGITTNELVFLLTPVEKKIKSGALSSERKDLLAEIKAQDLGAKVMKRFGRNATQVSTDNLKTFLAERKKSSVKELCEVAQEEQETVEETVEETNEEEAAKEEVATGTTCEGCCGNCTCKKTEMADILLREVVKRLIGILMREVKVGMLEGDYEELLHDLIMAETDSVTEEAESKEDKLSREDLIDMFDWV